MAEPYQEDEPFSFSVPFRCWEGEMQQGEFPLHWHSYFEIAHILDGETTLRINGVNYPARCGDLAVMSPSIVHGFLKIERTLKLRIYQFAPSLFSGEGRQRRAVHKQREQGISAPFYSAAPSDALYGEVLSLLDEAFNEYQKRERGYQYAIRAAFCRIALLYVRSMEKDDAAEAEKASSDKPEDNPGAAMLAAQRLERAIRLIYKDYGRADLRLEDGAQAASLSLFHFTRFFKEHTGKTFHEYLTEVRLSNAEESLFKTAFPITSIAYQCGFGSLATFNRLFRAKNHESPSDYRKRLKEGAEDETPQLLSNKSQ